jgi:hypothetical protein
VYHDPLSISREFPGADLTDAQLEALADVSGLEQLVIWGGPMTKARLAPLSRLTSLKGRVLGELAIDDAMALKKAFQTSPFPLDARNPIPYVAVCIL